MTYQHHLGFFPQKQFYDSETSSDIHGVSILWFYHSGTQWFNWISEYCFQAKKVEWNNSNNHPKLEALVVLYYFAISKTSKTWSWMIHFSCSFFLKKPMIFIFLTSPLHFSLPRFYVPHSSLPPHISTSLFVKKFPKLPFSLSLYLWMYDLSMFLHFFLSLIIP